MKNEIIKGDFPQGSSIDFSNYLIKSDIEISWTEGWRVNSFNLRGNIHSIEIVDKSQIQDESLTPLEGGIIGGSVAGLNGFLAGYLSLDDDEGAVIFNCYLRDGRYFIARSSPEIYNKLLEFSLE